MTRHALQEAGKALTTGLSAGTLVVVELTNESELFMIGVITKPKHTILVAVEVPEMGRLIPGDEVLEVRKFEPIPKSVYFDRQAVPGVRRRCPRCPETCGLRRSRRSAPFGPKYGPSHGGSWICLGSRVQADARRFAAHSAARSR